MKKPFLLILFARLVYKHPIRRVARKKSWSAKRKNAVLARLTGQILTDVFR